MTTKWEVTKMEHATSRVIYERVFTDYDEAKALYDWEWLTTNHGYITYLGVKEAS